jgi:hypothetical protein
MARLFWGLTLPSYTPLQVQEGNVIIQHVNGGVLNGMPVGDVWCGSPPCCCCENLCSSRNGTDPGRHVIGANGGASKSF